MDGIKRGHGEETNGMAGSEKFFFSMSHGRTKENYVNAKSVL